MCISGGGCVVPCEAEDTACHTIHSLGGWEGREGGGVRRAGGDGREAAAAGGGRDRQAAAILPTRRGSRRDGLRHGETGSGEQGRRWTVLPRWRREEEAGYTHLFVGRPFAYSQWCYLGRRTHAHLVVPHYTFLSTLCLIVCYFLTPSILSHSH